jgi:hypothetical protein
VCVCVCISFINFRKTEPVFMKPYVYIITPESILKAHYINPFHLSVCLSKYVYKPNFRMERLCKNVPVATNTRRRIEGMLGS